MRTSTFIRTISEAALIAACISCRTEFQEKELTGIWVQPVPGMSIVQGMELVEGGAARAVNTSTLLYDSWKLDRNNLILNGKSIGNGVTSEFSDTLAIVKVTADSLVLMKGTLRLGYRKSIEDCGFSANPGTIMKGTVTFGPEVRLFRPEGEERTYWIIDKSGYLQIKYNESGMSEWSAGAELELKEVDSTASEFGKEYDGTFQVLRIISISNN